MRARRWLMLFVFLLACAARSDVAIVVGINGYAPPNELHACENDARAMATLLAQKGFKIFGTGPILSAAATKKNIMDALASVGSTITANENFVFYYAGHGYPSVPQIVPIDCLPPDKPGIEATDLYEAISKIRGKCRTATVILDCCFSGGLSKGLSGLRSRCWVQPGISYGALEKSTGSFGYSAEGTQDLVAPPRLVTNARAICYVVAAKADQKSWEARVSDDHFNYHGLFTYFLKSQLQGPPELWGSIEGKVNAEIDALLAKYSKDNLDRQIQNPNVTQAFRPLRPFEPPTSSTPNMVPSTVLEQLADSPDPSKLTLVATPSKVTFRVGEPAQISVNVLQPGYLVVLSRDVQTQLVWPASKNVDQCKVPAGLVPLVGDKSIGSYNYPGTNQVIAVMFDTRAGAKRFLDKMKVKSKTYADLDAPLDPLPPADAKYATASLTSTVLESLAGDMEITDPGSLWAALESDDFGVIASNQLFDTPEYNPNEFDQLSKDVDGPPTLKNELTMRLNRLLYGSSNWADPRWASKLPANSPLATNLKDRKALDPDTGGALLAAMFPKWIQPAALPKPDEAGSQK
jgi:hypothetical protein